MKKLFLAMLLMASIGLSAQTLVKFKITNPEAISILKKDTVIAWIQEKPEVGTKIVVFGHEKENFWRTKDGKLSGERIFPDFISEIPFGEDTVVFLPRKMFYLTGIVLP